MLKQKGRILLIFFSVLFQVHRVTGQIIVEEEQKRLYYDRTRRITNFWEMKDMRDVTHKDKLLMGKNRISGNFSYNTGRVLIDNGEQTHYEIRSAIGYFTRIRFFEEFSFNTTFYQDFNPKASAQWTSNYTYSLARYNWKPYKFNFGYENYLNNRYTDNIQQVGDKFLQGYYFLSYNLGLSENQFQKIKLDESTNVKFICFARYAINYKDKYEVIHGGVIDGKATLGISLRYTIFKNIYVESAVYFYPEEIKKQPWDPDYSYGFGLFNWHSFRISATYGNWAVNRFPWNSNNYYPKYGFLDGNFKLAVNYIW